MRKVKSIILLISLIFIVAISVLVMKNLDDSEEFINIMQTSSKFTQTNILVNNTKNIIIELIKDKNLNEILDSLQRTKINILPLFYKDISVFIKVPVELDFNENYYLNAKNKSKLIKQLYDDEVYYPDDFVKIYKDKNITNFRQINYILDEYVSTTKDTNILKIQDKFNFISIDENTTAYRCDYDIDVSGLKSHVNMIVTLKNNKTDVILDFYFKE